MKKKICSIVLALLLVLCGVLTACDFTPPNYVTVFFREHGKVYAQKISENSLLNITSFGRDAYDFSKYSIEVLKESDVEFVIPELVKFVDIKGLTGTTKNLCYYETSYQYYTADAEYFLTEYSGGGSLSVVAYTASESLQAEYNWFGDFENNCFSSYNFDTEESSFYRILGSGDDLTVYEVEDTVIIDEQIRLDAAFLADYAHNGILYVELFDRTTKSNYIDVSMRFDSYNDQIAVKDGQTLSLSKYSIPGKTAHFDYNSFFFAEDLPFADLFSAANVAKYTDYVKNGSTGALSLVGNDVPTNYSFFFNATTANDFSVSFTIDEQNTITDNYLCYSINVYEGKYITVSAYSFLDFDYEYYFVAQDADGVFMLCDYEAKTFTGKFTDEEFDVFKALALNANLFAAEIEVSYT